MQLDQLTGGFTPRRELFRPALVKTGLIRSDGPNCMCQHLDKTAAKHTCLPISSLAAEGVEMRHCIIVACSPR